MENTDKIEQEISEVVKSKILPESTLEEIKAMIRKEIINREYLAESDWQIHYVIERINGYLNNDLKIRKPKINKSEIIKLIINFAIALFFYSFIFHGVFNIQLGGIFGLVVLGGFYLVVVEMKEFTYNLILAFFIYILLAINILKVFNTDKMWLIFILIIISYIIAKQIRFMLNKYLKK